MWWEDVDIQLLTFSKFHIDAILKPNHQHEWRFTGFLANQIMLGNTNLGNFFDDCTPFLTFHRCVLVILMHF